MTLFKTKKKKDASKDMSPPFPTQPQRELQKRQNKKTKYAPVIGIIVKYHRRIKNSAGKFARFILEILHLKCGDDAIQRQNARGIGDGEDEQIAMHSAAIHVH